MFLLKTLLLAVVLGLSVLSPLSAVGTAEAPKANPKEVNISWVRSPFNIQVMVMRDQGLLEKAFAAQGVRVVWHEITSGAQQTLAMASGSLDIASVVNTSSLLMANAAGNPVWIIAPVSRPKQTFAVMVNEAGPRDIAQLKGKTVAGPKGTVLHQILAAGLVSRGLKLEDINFLNMGLPEARTALVSGQVDAALQAGALIIRGQESGQRVLFDAEGLVNPLLVSAVRPGFAQAYPHLTELYVKTQVQAARWILENPSQALAIGARLQEVSPADAQKLYRWNGMTQEFTDEDREGLRQDLAFLVQQGMVAAPLDTAKLFWKPGND
ncbi:MAG TPA: ABC transporter substrate-binding protein [Magnetospirillaceae bacterium]|nr:ABC transporter substrate-binding protein [Magnetospirillaceae bacterium]